VAQNEPLWFLGQRKNWHKLNRNAWHYKTGITGTNRTEISKYNVEEDAVCVTV